MPSDPERIRGERTLLLMNMKRPSWACRWLHRWFYWNTWYDAVDIPWKRYAYCLRCKLDIDPDR